MASSAIAASVRPPPLMSIVGASATLVTVSAMLFETVLAAPPVLPRSLTVTTTESLPKKLPFGV